MPTTIQLTATEIVAILKKTPLFSSIDTEKAYHNLAAICTVKEFRTGEYILNQQDNTNHASVIYEGTARVYRAHENHTGITLALLGKGDIIGELSLLDGGKRSATIEAIEPVQVLELHHDDFISFLKEHGTVAVELIKVLVRRLRATSQLTEEMQTAKLAVRTLHMLEALANLHGQSKTITISQEELARIVGASRPRVTEALQELEAQGKISRKWRSITLVVH
jgi:CRP/FNR family transcriptional regulator, cyclic AMP receptor protein